MQRKTPIVAVMGHVDHGKTSLLDSIRGTKVVDTEHGGITQSVRAHQIEVERDGESRKITFIDTPGHEAFHQMRSRGSEIADVAIIVIAHNDGIQSQTIESAKFAKENNLPIIIALNKIDLPGENEQKLLTDLSAKAGVNTEEFGGDAILVKVSAKTGEGLDKLLDSIFLLYDLQTKEDADLTGSLAEGIVLEANVDKSFGNVALVILKKSQIAAKGTFYVANSQFSSKIRTLLNSNQIPQDVFFSGDPVWLVGLEETPNVGQLIRIFDDKKVAENEVQDIRDRESENVDFLDPISILKNISNAAESSSERKRLNVILKADTMGSLEVVAQELMKLNDDFVEVVIKEKGVGEINQSEVRRAKDIGAIVIGFRSKVQDDANRLARQERILVKSYQIIYELVEELEDALTGLLEPEEEEVEVARASVKNVFKLTNGDWIAGCSVQKGTVIKGYKARLERSEEIVGKGKITSLKILKNEVKEVEKGKECGIMIEPNIEPMVGDVVVLYKVEH
ncbi:translation initiation factor IF-2 [bacterium]|nr:MAG: translation initiation factor IF-2 [bacterium]